MLLIKFDTTYVNKTTICFGDRTLLSFISTIKIDILTGITNFYIIDTSISFLLYLKKIDILSIYLNNITNQLICQDYNIIFIICN